MNLYKKIFSWDTDPWKYAKSIRRKKTKLKISIVSIMIFTFIVICFGEVSKVKMLIFGLSVSIFLGIMIKFVNVNFITEIHIRKDKICFQLVEKTIIISKNEIKEIVYTLYYVYIFWKVEKDYMHIENIVCRTLL